MPVMEPLEGARAENQDQQRGLLEAIANAGAAGKKAYQDAKSEVDRARAAALERAMQRSGITGQDFGGADLAPVTETADRFGAYFSGQDAAHQAHLGSIGASADSYLAKVNAIAPFIQSQNMNRAADRDNQYKTAIAQAQAKLDADKAQRAQDHAWDLEKMSLQNRYSVDASNRQTAAKAALEKTKEPKLPKIEELMAGAQTATDLQSQATPNNRLIDTHPQLADILIGAADRSAYNGTDYKTEVAKALGEVGYQLTPTQINTIFYKSDTKADQDAQASALSRKYANKGVNYDLAKSVLGNVDFQRDVQQIISGAGGRSREEVDGILRQYYTVDRNWPSEYYVLAGEYLPLLPTKAQLDKLAEG